MFRQNPCSSRGFLIASLFAFASLAHAESMQHYMQTTDKLIKEGKNEEALDRIIWFHEHALEKDPAMTGVRLSFALSRWKEFGDKYAPAKLALIETRDNTLKKVLEKDGTVQQFWDVESINRVLEADDDTVELFKRLDQSNPKLAERSWQSVKSLIIAHKEYELAQKYIGGFSDAYEEIENQYITMKKFAERGPSARSLATYAKKDFIKESVELINFALAIGNSSAAKEIQAKAIKHSDDRKLLNAIPTDSKQASNGGKSSKP